MFDLASTIAPASLIFLTWNASLSDTNPASASDPLALCKPIVSKLSLTIVGMQCSGPDEAALLEALIHGIGLLQRLGVGDDDGVDGRAVLVERIDAPQILLDEPAAGEPAGLHRRVNLRDGGFVDFEWRRRLRRGQ